MSNTNNNKGPLTLGNSSPEALARLVSSEDIVGAHGFSDSEVYLVGFTIIWKNMVVSPAPFLGRHPTLEGIQQRFTGGLCNFMPVCPSSC